MAGPAAVRHQEYVAVPSGLFGPLLEALRDPAELRCALRAFFLLHRKRGALRFVTPEELLQDPVLRANGASGGEDAHREAATRALEACVQHGLLLDFPVEDDATKTVLYLMDTAANRRGLERVRSGELPVPALPRARPAAEGTATQAASLFALYEANIGPIFPMAAERLKAIEGEYPRAWVDNALVEAVRHNHRSLAYIEAILRRWKDDGRGDGAAGRHPGQVPLADIFRRVRGR